MTLTRWTPYRSLGTLPVDVDRFFNRFWDYNESDTVWSPSVDISETEDKYEVKAELPGLDKKEINVAVENNVLRLSGERKHEEKKDDKNYHRIERFYGKFERTFRLPERVQAENIKAHYKNGVLTVEIPKAEELKPRGIEIS